MDSFLSSVLNKINFDPALFGIAFGKRLSLKEEFMLFHIEKELGLQMEAILDHVLLGGGTEILISQATKCRILELGTLRNSIIDLLQERGNLSRWPEALN